VAAPDALEARLRELGAFIRDQRRRDRLSLRKPSAEILQAIAKGLQISAETLYVHAGILEARTDGPDLEAEIRRDPSLTERQKDALTEIYRSFQRETAELRDAGATASEG
jgi:hypothetical protein